MESECARTRRCDCRRTRQTVSRSLLVDAHSSRLWPTNCTLCHDRLPADPRFARAGHLQHRCVSSPVSLKDVVMTRACSKDRNDLNRDPAVRKTYRRNNAGRLESMDTLITSGVDTQDGSPIFNDKGKRPLLDQPSLHEPPSKRCRASNDDSLPAAVSGATGMSETSESRHPSSCVCVSR